MADDTRISDLERLLAAEPASIAFAQLGEEYRRAGKLDAALRICREGLSRYPSHHSARITLARVLVAKGLPEEARAELDIVAREAPDNVAVRTALAGGHRVADAANAADHDQRILNELERWLAAIHADRAQRFSPAPLPKHSATP